MDIDKLRKLVPIFQEIGLGILKVTLLSSFGVDSKKLENSPDPLKELLEALTASELQLHNAVESIKARLTETEPDWNEKKPLLYLVDGGIDL